MTGINKQTKAIALVMMSIFIAAIMITVFSGNAQQKEDRISVVTSFYPIYSAVSRLTQGIDGVEVINLTPSQTGCLHDYQLVPDDIIALTNADALVINGLGMESFLEDSIDLNPDIKVLDTSIGATLLPGIHSHNEHHSEHYDQHEHENQFNEHIWTSPSNHIIQVKNIKDFLVKIDPEHADEYNNNAKNYISEIEDIKNELINTARMLPTKNCIVFHDSLCYFAKEMGFSPIAMLSLGEQSYLSASQLADAASAAKKSSKVLLLYDMQHDAKYNNVADGASYVRILKLDTAVAGKANDADAWINAMRHNLMQLKEVVN